MHIATIAQMSMNRTSSAIQFPADELAAYLPSGWSLDIPLVRISMCGTLSVEVLQEVQRDEQGQLHASYAPPATSLVQASFNHALMREFFQVTCIKSTA